MIETRRLKNVVIFFQTILSFVLSRKNIKMSETTDYERNRDVILKRDNEYYEHSKEVLREKGKNKYR